MSRRWGAVLGWGALAVVVVIGVLLVWSAGRDSDASGHVRSPDDPGEHGAMAIAEVLREQGVDVTITRSFAETRAAVDDSTTLLLDDDWWMLTPAAYADVARLADHLVLVQPNDDALEALAPGVDYAGFAGGETPASCALPAAERAGTIDATGDSYTAPESATRCFPTSDGAHALVRVAEGDRVVTVLGAAHVLGNSGVLEHGHAALAFGLLGESPRLVWYQPDVADTAFQPEGTLAERQAAWYLPLVLLLLLVGVAAAVWRGRRMGPVVVEDLPVEVRSSETMDGRARLYERGAARDHALGTLRAATAARIGHALGLPRTAPVTDIVNAAASLTGRTPADLDALLRTASAGDERTLVRLSDELLRLERETAEASTPR